MVDLGLVVDEAYDDVGENVAMVGGLGSWSVLSEDALLAALGLEGAMSVIQGVSVCIS